MDNDEPMLERAELMSMLRAGHGRTAPTIDLLTIRHSDGLGDTAILQSVDGGNSGVCTPDDIRAVVAAGAVLGANPATNANCSRLCWILGEFKKFAGYVEKMDDRAKKMKVVETRDGVAYLVKGNTPTPL